MLLLKCTLVLASLYICSFIVGWFVENRNLRVNYARKILSIGFFLITAFVLTFIEVERTAFTYIVNAFMPVIWAVSFLYVFRSRVKFLRTCFAAIDRPEDRPFTLIWLISAMIIGYIILFFMIEWLRIYNIAHLMLIPVFVSTFGDGLAEPIGIRYGRHAYKVRALFTKKLYQRTYEGSACVFISAVAAVLGSYEYVSLPQFLFLMFVMPPVMTLTEAKSPHTWDNPFIFLAGGLIIFLSSQFALLF